MSNMSYCRFGNTAIDLEDCIDALQQNENLVRDLVIGSKRGYHEELAGLQTLLDSAQELLDLVDMDELRELERTLTADDVQSDEEEDDE